MADPREMAMQEFLRRQPPPGTITPDVYEDENTSQQTAGAFTDAAAVIAAALNVPIEAVRNILQNYRPGPQNEPLNQDIGREAMGAASVMAPGVMRAGRGELGAAGGKLTAEQIEAMMQRLGYENVRRAPPKSGNSQYIYGDPPGNPPRSSRDTPTVRVSEDEHLGRPLSGREIGNRYDTGTPDPTVRTRHIMPEEQRVNQAGQPFADPEALEGVLRWRKGELVSPDQAPKAQRHIAEPAAPPVEGGPINDPRQLRLLSGGVPVPGGWQTEVVPADEAGDVGRFSRKIASADDQLVNDTREMTEKLRRERKSIWDQFEKVGE